METQEARRRTRSQGLSRDETPPGFQGRYFNGIGWVYGSDDASNEEPAPEPPSAVHHMHLVPVGGPNLAALSPEPLPSTLKQALFKNPDGTKYLLEVLRRLRALDKVVSPAVFFVCVSEAIQCNPQFLDQRIEDVVRYMFDVHLATHDTE